MNQEKELLKTVRHIALATVNEDGTPHNTPLFGIFSDDYTKLYWGSHPNSLHSQNIERTGEGFVIVFDSITPGKGGLYIAVKNGHRVTDEELPHALEVHNARRAKESKDPLPLSYYQAPNAQRMYTVDIVKIERYGAERDQDGHILKEGRVEVRPEELLT